jgi:CheY-like chemotaxis protein
MKRVLLVEGDAGVVHALCHALGGHFDVDVAGNANIADALLRQHAYDAVVTDFELPDGDGIWVLDRCRKLRPGARRVLTSTRDASRFAGTRVMQRFVQKPATAETLLRALGVSGGSSPATVGAVASKLTLAIHDLAVLRFELPAIFKCHARRIVEFYDQHVSDRHLDVGIGTGYFLDRCRFPVAAPEIHLLDLNPDCLDRASRRLRRYRPITHCCDVLEPIREPLPRFGSIAAASLLHRLPGTMLEKEGVLRNLKPFLREGGTLFGVTVLGQGVDGTGALYRWANRLYNRKSIFCNLHDNAADLTKILAANFAEHSVEIVGSVAFFRGIARG